MFGLFKSRHAEVPQQVAPAAPVEPVSAASVSVPVAVTHLPDGPTITVIPNIIATSRAAKAACSIIPSARDVATGTLAYIDREGDDSYWTVSELDAWVAAFAARAGLDLSLVRMADVRLAIRCTPGVSYAPRRYRAEPQLARLKFRVEASARARGQRPPEKVWIFTLPTLAATYYSTSETVSPVLIRAATEALAGSLADGSPQQARNQEAQQWERGGIAPESAAESSVLDGVLPRTQRRVGVG